MAAKKRERSRLFAENVMQPHLFGVTEDGCGVLRLSAALRERLGWHAGQKVFFRELPCDEDRRMPAALLVEVE